MQMTFLHSIVFQDDAQASHVTDTWSSLTSYRGNKYSRK